MKHSLGKTVLFFVAFIMLQAEDFVHTYHVDKQSPYVKEAVILTLELNQTNPNVVLIFDFDIAKSSDYTFQRLDIKETDAGHSAQVHYVYLLYPLKSGKIDIHFSLTKKVTTDDSVAYSFSGDRDNVKGLVTKDSKVSLPPVTLNVKAVPKDTDFVGDFALDYALKKQEAKTYEALPFRVSIKGVGYPPLLARLLPTDINFTLFTQKPIVQSIMTTQGTKSTVTYPMAVSHHTNFTLPPIALKAFNPRTKKVYTLKVPSQDINIQKVPKRTLVDSIDMPLELKADWSWLISLLGYIVVFVAGFFTALAFKWQKRGKPHRQTPLTVKIQDAKNQKALLQLLMANDSHRFAKSIEKLEDSLYGDGKITLSKVKQEAQDLL